jgi:hypothetical protein
MPEKARLTRMIKACLAGGRAAVTNFAVPVLIAWLLTNVLHDRLHPSHGVEIAPNGDLFGAVRLKVKLPGTSAGIPEPLIVCGEAGNASLVYIRLLSGSQAKVGVEFWGMRAYESETFPLPAMDGVIDIKCYLPALFPKEGDPYWGTLAPTLQRIRRTQYFITVDNVVRLKGPLTYEQRPHMPIYFGANPLGGSLVSDRFSGTVLESSQE